MLTDFLEETPEDLAVAAKRSRGEILALLVGYLTKAQLFSWYIGARSQVSLTNVLYPQWLVCWGMLRVSVVS